MHEMIPQIHQQAEAAAQAAASKFFTEKLGGQDQFACGFAWVTVHNVRSNSKVGKALQAVGFRRAYGGGLQLWNPSKFGCQNVDTLEHGAMAYATVLKQHGIEAYAGSRLD